MHLVVLLLGPVSNKLEAANNLANREETDDLSNDDAGTDPLLLRGTPYAVEQVDGLCGAGFDGTGAHVEEAGGVLERVGHGLEVLLEGGHVTVHLLAFCGPSWRVLRHVVRWCHAALVNDELAELKTDS
jgi:hypothetical protein